MPLLPENLREEERGWELLTDPSSSPLSGGTERILCILLGDLGKAGDLGGARDRCDLVDPLVNVRLCAGAWVGVCANWIDSTLLVRLGMFVGVAACTLTVLLSTGSGDIALGRPMAKYPSRCGCDGSSSAS